MDVFTLAHLQVLGHSYWASDGLLAIGFASDQYNNPQVNTTTLRPVTGPTDMKTSIY